MVDAIVPHLTSSGTRRAIARDRRQFTFRFWLFEVSADQSAVLTFFANTAPELAGFTTRTVNCHACGVLVVADAVKWAR